MAVNAPAAYGVYSDHISLQQVVQTLNQSGFDNDQICLMLWPRHPVARVVRAANIFNGEPERNASTVVLMRWLMKLGAVIIPTVGFFIRSRAFLHDLVMTADSPGLSGNSRTLVGLGFAEDDAERLEREFRQMGVLLYVACPEKARTAQAVEILRQAGASRAAMLERAAVREAAA